MRSRAATPLGRAVTSQAVAWALLALSGCAPGPDLSAGDARALVPRLPAWSSGQNAAVSEVGRAWSRADVEGRLRQADYAVWEEGDVLHFACRARAEDVMLAGGIQTPMRRLPDSDLWVVAARVKDLDQAAILYSFLPDFQKGAMDAAPLGGSWRGATAPAPPPSAWPLAGETCDLELDSRHLNARRALTVYLPPGHGPRTETTVVYLTDGQSTAEYARFIEPAIQNRQLPPLLLVGMHAATARDRTGPDDDPRGAEYLEIAGDERFLRHERFFLEEVLPRAEKEWGAARDSGRRVLFGASNGAAFALSMLLAHPDRFQSAAAFSVAGGPPERAGRAGQRACLLVGTLEGGLSERNHTRLWAAHLSAAGADVSLATRVAGHDRLMWTEELPRALAWLLRRELEDFR